MDDSFERERMLPEDETSTKPQNPTKISCCPFNYLVICGFVFTFVLSLLWLFGMESSTPLSHRQNFLQLSSASRQTLMSIPKLHRKSSLPATNISLRSPRILCWIMTQPANHIRKAIHVQNTWAPRCDKFLFMTTFYATTNSNDNRLKNVVALNSTTTRNDEFSTRKFLWARTKQAFRYCYEHFLNDYEWFMKADDDTYVIVENLRHMVAPFNASEPWYFARMVMHSLSGGAGYVLSREALRRFIENGLSSSAPLPSPAVNEESYCHRLDDIHADDMQMNRCLKALGISEASSTDEKGKGKMWNFPLQPRTYRGELYFHYWNSQLDPLKPQLTNISRYSVSFHHVTPSAMYTYDYLLYHIGVFGEKLSKND